MGGLRMTEPLTVSNKDDFKAKFVGQTNKLTLNKGTSLFMLFGKEAELIEFQAPGEANHRTKTSSGNWKSDAFYTALAACEEATPMKMWFRGLNKEYKASAETKSRRRLFAL